MGRQIFGKVTASLFLFGSIGLSSPAFAGDRYVGEWAGEDATSIEVISQSPLTVHYCIKDDCQNWNPKGTADDMEFWFPDGNNFPGATMTMKRDGEVYRGVYQQVGSDIVYKVTLTKDG